MLVVTAREFFSFLKNPNLDKSPQNSALFKLKFLLNLFLLELPLVAFIELLIFLLYKYEFIIESEEPLRVYRDLINRFGYTIFLLLAIIVIPLFEELVFRSYLTWPRFFKLRFLIDHFSWLFYFSAIVFALVHITNIPKAEINGFIPILLASQFVGGLFIGLLRIKLGLLWGFLFHALHNLFWIGLFVAFGGLPSF